MATNTNPTPTTDASDASAEASVPSTFGFKFLNGFSASGNYTSDKSRVKRITSDYDGSEWTLGEWRTITGTIRNCTNGYHLSPSPRQAYGYVNGNILALVEARGDCDHESDKSSHREMRIVAWWPYDAYTKLSRADQEVEIPAEAQAAYDAAVMAAGEAMRAVYASADTARNEAIKPALDALNAAQNAARPARDLARSLAKVTYDQATSVARLVYDAAVKVADLDYTFATSAETTAHTTATYAAREVYEQTTEAGREVQRLAVCDAESARAAAIQAVSGGLVTQITAKLGKPAEGSLPK